MIELTIVVVCILLNGILSASEMSFVTVRKSQLREASKKGSKQADYLLTLRSNPERTLSIVQIGITLVGAIAAAVGGAGAEEFLSPILESKLQIKESLAEGISIAVVVIPITYLSVVFGELIPKSLALKNAFKISILSSYIFAFLDRILSPVVTLLEESTRIFLSLLLKKKKDNLHDIKEIETNIELDSLPEIQRQYVLNVVDLGRKTLQSVCTPWSNVVSVHRNQSIEEVETVLLTSGHTRVPVFSGTEAVGLLNSREFMALRATGETNWTRIVRDPISIQSKTPLLNSLRLLQEKKSHMALVLSEHIQIGIVTMEDILEEVIGDIYDEDDDGALKKILSAGIKRKLS